MDYQAPLQDFEFIFKNILPFKEILSSERFAHTDGDMVRDMLSHASKFSSEVLAPHYWESEVAGAKCHDKKVTMPAGSINIYKQFCEGGYGTVSASEEFGGMGLPTTVFTAIFEMISSAHMGFGLCPLLTQGAIHALEVWGTDEQKSLYLPKLISGEWSGTMNLTEPQAGSDVGKITTKAIPQEDGTYLIKGSKIYITYGDHDMAKNIIHLVLARLPDSPAGTKGISLFIVPKILIDKEGNLGEANDVFPSSIEEKLGIHSSPTCTMQFGDDKGAVGYLIGPKNGGMRAMFTMMNDARLQVGAQGVAVSEIAFQKALAYAKERKQGTPLPNGMKEKTKEELSKTVAIIEHPDVQRQLLSLRVHNYIARLLVLQTAFHSDQAQSSTDEEEKLLHQAYADFMTPIAKAWPTDRAIENTSRAVQIFGGLGFVEETQIACHFRDARITPIYEGTNGIQAIDLITRKIGRNEMQVFRDLSEKIASLSNDLLDHGNEDLAAIGDYLEFANDDLLQTIEWLYQKWWLLDQGAEALAGAEPAMNICGIVIGGYLAALGALNAVKNSDGDISKQDQEYIDYARFYAENALSNVKGLSIAATRGTSSLKAVQNWL